MSDLIREYQNSSQAPLVLGIPAVSSAEYQFFRQELAKTLIFDLLYTGYAQTEVKILPPSSLQARLRQQWPTILDRARQAQLNYPEPIQALVDLLNDLPGDYDSWREILEEPYG